jgi:hypothetical protein
LRGNDFRSFNSIDGSQSGQSDRREEGVGAGASSSGEVLGRERECFLLYPTIAAIAAGLLVVL